MIKSLPGFCLCLLCLAGCSIMIWPSYRSEIGPKGVIFTFDDGPNPRDDITLRLVAVLNRHKIKGVFCVLGRHVDENPDLLKEVYKSGHIIVNHGYNHLSPLKEPAERIFQDIEECDAAIGRALGIENYRSRYYRPPYGMYTPSFKEELYSRGMRIFPVTFYEQDTFTGPAEKDGLKKDLLRRIMKKEGGIILIHEFIFKTEPVEEEEYSLPRSGHNRSFVPELVNELAAELKERGFVFPVPD